MNIIQTNYEKNLQLLSSSTFFSPCLIVNKQGALEKTHLFRAFLEKIKGLFGYCNYTHKTLLQLKVFQLLNHGNNWNFSKETIDRIQLLAKRTGLICPYLHKEAKGLSIEEHSRLQDDLLKKLWKNLADNDKEASNELIYDFYLTHENRLKRFPQSVLKLDLIFKKNLPKTESSPSMPELPEPFSNTKEKSKEHEDEKQNDGFNEGSLDQQPKEPEHRLDLLPQEEPLNKQSQKEPSKETPIVDQESEKSEAKIENLPKPVKALETPPKKPQSQNWMKISGAALTLLTASFGVYYAWKNLAIDNTDNPLASSNLAKNSLSNSNFSSLTPSLTAFKPWVEKNEELFNYCPAYILERVSNANWDLKEVANNLKKNNIIIPIKDIIPNNINDTITSNIINTTGNKIIIWKNETSFTPSSNFTLQNSTSSPLLRYALCIGFIAIIIFRKNIYNNLKSLNRFFNPINSSEILKEPKEKQNKTFILTAPSKNDLNSSTLSNTQNPTDDNLEFNVPQVNEAVVISKKLEGDKLASLTFTDSRQTEPLSDEIQAASPEPNLIQISLNNSQDSSNFCENKPLESDENYSASDEENSECKHYQEESDTGLDEFWETKNNSSNLQQPLIVITEESKLEPTNQIILQKEINLGAELINGESTDQIGISLPTSLMPTPGILPLTEPNLVKTSLRSASLIPRSASRIPRPKSSLDSSRKYNPTTYSPPLKSSYKEISLPASKSLIPRPKSSLSSQFTLKNLTQVPVSFSSFSRSTSSSLSPRGFSTSSSTPSSRESSRASSPNEIKCPELKNYFKLHQQLKNNIFVYYETGTSDAVLNLVNPIFDKAMSSTQPQHTFKSLLNTLNENLKKSYSLEKLESFAGTLPLTIEEEFIQIRILSHIKIIAHPITNSHNISKTCSLVCFDKEGPTAFLSHEYPCNFKFETKLYDSAKSALEQLPRTFTDQDRIFNIIQILFAKISQNPFLIQCLNATENAYLLHFENKEKSPDNNQIGRIFMEFRNQKLFENIPTDSISVPAPLDDKTVEEIYKNVITPKKDTHEYLNVAKNSLDYNI